MSKRSITFGRLNGKAALVSKGDWEVRPNPQGYWQGDQPRVYGIWSPCGLLVCLLAFYWGGALAACHKKPLFPFAPSEGKWLVAERGLWI